MSSLPRQSFLSLPFYNCSYSKSVPKSLSQLGNPAQRLQYRASVQPEPLARPGEAEQRLCRGPRLPGAAAHQRLPARVASPWGEVSRLLKE